MNEPSSDALIDFLRTIFPVIVGTKRRDGTVQLNPAWFEYRDGSFWLNSWRGARWLAHIERDRAATLLLVDPINPSRVAQAQTRLVQTRPDAELQHADRLSERYTGQPYQGPPVRRVTIQLQPTRITNSVDQLPNRRAGDAQEA
ncbi:MAG: pyridoxamine 5'-phosphate oxidase family protein [Solirubrobacteraceae bacterium]